MTNKSSHDPTASPWLTPREAAIHLNISLGTLRNWTSQRFIPFAKKGGVVRYHQEGLDRWLAKGGCEGRTILSTETTAVEEGSP
jgi:excisionase family DNA binding protein